jgi:hypothetical protein
VKTTAKRRAKSEAELLDQAADNLARAATSSARNIIFQIPIPWPHHLKKEPHDGIHHAALK